MTNRRKRRKKVKRARGGASHSCPRCGSNTEVTVTRRNSDGRVERARQCLDCGHKFNTIEKETTQ